MHEVQDVFSDYRYNTYVSHFKENECFRQVYEPLLLQHSVDILFFGELAAYLVLPLSVI